MPDILSYYEEELKALKNTGRLFSQKYPDVAYRIGFEDFDDPHIKRLVESFSFLAARLHLRADEHYPELIQSLLKSIAPHFLQPFPSVSIAQFQNIQAKSFVPRHTPLFSNEPALCKFYTVYPLTLFPVVLHNVDIVSRHHYHIHTEWQDRFTEWPSYFLRLELEGECEELTFYIQHPDTLSSVYENIFSYERAFVSYNGKQANLLPKKDFHALGFARNETALLPMGVHHHTLLQEYFHFPEKFMFANIKSLKAKDRFEILIPVKEKIPFHKNNILLHCTPIINLFPHTLEPIQLTQKKTFFPLIPQVNRSMDIYSIKTVEAFSHQKKTEIPSLEETSKECFWSLKYNDRQPFIKIHNFNEEGILHIKALCSNQDEPHDISVGASLEIEIALKAQPFIVKRPSFSYYPDLDNKMLWHIFQTLTTHESNIESILPLYNYQKTFSIKRAPKVRRLNDQAWRGFVQGEEITLDIDDFLLGTVLKHYFDLIADINSFIDTKIHT